MPFIHTFVLLHFIRCKFDFRLEARFPFEAARERLRMKSRKGMSRGVAFMKHKNKQCERTCKPRNARCGSYQRNRLEVLNMTDAGHPAVIYYMGVNAELKHKSLVVISDELAQTVAIVFAFLKAIVGWIKHNLAHTQQIHYLSDSPISQYRNDNIFNLVSLNKAMFGIYV